MENGGKLRFGASAYITLTLLSALALFVAIPVADAAAAKKKRADLVVKALDDPPPALLAGATLEISDKVKNRGRRAKRSVNAYFLSEDRFHDRADPGVGSRRVPKLKRGKSSRGTAQLTLPATMPTGEYRLIACADARGKVREKRESNNCRASDPVIQVAGPDTTPPGVPTINDTDPDPPAAENNPRVTGTGAEPGSTVRIYGTADCSGAPLGTGSAEAFGSLPGITVVVPSDQTTNLRATATDPAGNASACSAPFAYTHDSSLPPTPTINDTDPDSPSTDASPEVKGFGAESGSTVLIYSGSNCLGTPIATGTAATFNGAGITAPVPSNQTTQLHVTARDTAGNTSGCSGAFLYTHDSIAPGTPTITSTSPSSPSQDFTPQVIGTGAEGGSTVKVYANPSCTGTPLGTGTAAAFQSSGITLFPGVPPNQTSQLRVTATDAAGNVSGCSGPFPYTHDQSAPGAPTIIDTDPDSPSTDASPEVKGVAEPGSTVNIYATAACSGSALGTGSEAQFSGTGITVTVGLGPTDLHATSTDAAGNRSACSATPFPYLLLP